MTLIEQTAVDRAFLGKEIAEILVVLGAGQGKLQISDRGDLRVLERPQNDTLYGRLPFRIDVVGNHEILTFEQGNPFLPKRRASMRGGDGHKAVLLKQQAVELPFAEDDLLAGILGKEVGTVKPRRIAETLQIDHFRRLRRTVETDVPQGAVLIAYGNRNAAAVGIPAQLEAADRFFGQAALPGQKAHDFFVLCERLTHLPDIRLADFSRTGSVQVRSRNTRLVAEGKERIPEGGTRRMHEVIESPAFAAARETGPLAGFIVEGKGRRVVIVERTACSHPFAAVFVLPLHALKERREILNPA